MEVVDAVPFDVAEDEESNTPNYSAYAKQIFIAFVIIVGSVWSGMTYECAGALSPTIANSHHISEETVSVFRNTAVSLGAICSGFLMRYIGRKRSLQVTNILMFNGCICMLFIGSSMQQQLVLAGCSLNWFAGTAFLAIGRIYIAEIAAPELRGLFGVLICIAITCGSLLNHTFGLLGKSEYGLRVCFTTSTVSLILISFIPESPHWLLRLHRSTKAKKIFLNIRGNDPTSDRELNALLIKDVGSLMDNVFSKKFFNAFVLLNFMMLVQRASGIDLEPKILTKIFDLETVQWSFVLLDLLYISSALLLCVLMVTLGRRCLFFTSSVSTFISLWVWSYIRTTVAPSEVVFIPMLILYNFSIFMGVNQIPWIIATEIYPGFVRDIGMSFTITFSILLRELIQNGQLIRDYWLYSTLVLIGSIVSYFIMPETIDTTLQEAEDKITNEILKFS